MRSTSPEGGTVDRRAFLEETETTAFIVLRGGDLVVEEYYGDASHGSTMTSFSIAKSFMSTLFGIAIDEGSIGGLDEPITDYLPELAERDERFGRIDDPASDDDVVGSPVRRAEHAVER